MNNITNFSAIALSIGVAIALLYDIRHSILRLISARNVALLTIVVWYAADASWISDEMQKYTQSQYNKAVLCVALAIISFLFVYYRVKGGLFDDFAKRLGSLENPNMLWILFLVALAIGMLPLVTIAQGDLTLVVAAAFRAGKRFSGMFDRGRYGGLRDAFLELQMFLKAAIPLAAVIILDRRQSLSRKVCCVLFCLWMFGRAATGGTRSEMVVVVMPILAVIYFKLSPSFKRLAIMVGLPIVAAIGVVWAEAVVVTRQQGNFDWSAASSANVTGFEMFSELLYLSNHVPDPLDYQFGQTYFDQLVNPIPRFIWPDKPVSDAGLLLAQAKGEVAAKTGEAYLTRSPGLIGEMYWNFGWLGIVVLSGMAGYALKSWDRLIQIQPNSPVSFVIFAAGLGLIFLSGRSFTMPIYYGMLALYVLVWWLPKQLSPSNLVRTEVQSLLTSSGR
ncbi:MAG TPA: O-antigen polymerase [Pirellulales bacterium]|nr:O-antigen polymerase [Pirellulales bacterium]